MNLEANMKELDNITKKLEKGSLSLEESTSLYEKGISLLKNCVLELKSQKEKIVKIEEDAGQIFEHEFDIE